MTTVWAIVVMIYIHGGGYEPQYVVPGGSTKEECMKKALEYGVPVGTTRTTAVCVPVAARADFIQR